jgi:membrane protease YdiL (CAAX protease family)
VSVESDQRTAGGVRWLPAYQPRRPVPWQGLDLLLIVAVYYVLPLFFLVLVNTVICPGILSESVSDVVPLSAEHSVLKLIKTGDPWIWLLCFVSGVIVAPLGEEFFFRVLLQGWLETVENRWRHRLLWLRRVLPRAVASILLSALPFAAMHFRTESAHPAQVLVIQLFAVIVVNLATMAFAIYFLRVRVGATAADFGWNPKTLVNDVCLGLLWFFAIIVPIYAIQLTLSAVLPASVAADPIPLFVFALILGFVYFRTHRILPALVIHAALNATSLTLVLLSEGLSRTINQ